MDNFLSRKYYVTVALKLLLEIEVCFLLKYYIQNTYEIIPFLSYIYIITLDNYLFE